MNNAYILNKHKLIQSSIILFISPKPNRFKARLCAFIKYASKHFDVLSTVSMLFSNMLLYHIPMVSSWDSCIHGSYKRHDTQPHHSIQTQADDLSIHLCG